MILIFFWLIEILNNWKAFVILAFGQYILHELFAAIYVGIAVNKHTVVIAPQFFANHYIKIKHLLYLLLYTLAQTPYIASLLKILPNPHNGVTQVIEIKWTAEVEPLLK